MNWTDPRLTEWALLALFLLIVLVAGVLLVFLPIDLHLSTR